jgi:ABC-2 type transport system ATP-binding protein
METMTTDAATPFVELQDLVVHYGKRQVLRGMTAALAGKSVGLLGPNGAGKSTLIKALLGFLRPTSGRASILGRDVQSEALAIRQFIGYMPEHEAFVKDLSAVRLLRYVGELSGLPPRDAMERAHEVLYYVGLGEARYRPVQTLSLGNQQRVKLAQALVHGPRVLILDEPTNALDHEGREDMLHLVRDIGAIAGCHIILCSHLLRDVEFCCDAVTVIHDGRVVLNGSLEGLRKEDLRTYELTVDGDPERFLGALAERGWECSEGQQLGIRVTLPPGATSRALFEVAASLGMQVRHFHHRRDSLEDVFLNAIQESQAASAGKAGADEPSVLIASGGR